MQLRDLMMYIEAQRLVWDASPDLGMDKASVAVPPAPPTASNPVPKRRTTGRKN